jgi:cell division protein FtsW
VLLTAFCGIVIVSTLFGIYKISNGEMFKRVGTGISRLKLDTDPTQLHELSGDEFQERLGKIHQPNAAKIAVYEGGLIGKGPGGSTQKYAVPVMFGDYMFSFILEEYGIWLGLFVILLYSSILARGAWIAKLCETNYARTAIGGLSFLITSQAFLHMFINVDMGPLTGQTLPLVSHGTSSFLSFCVAFGVILAISRMANKQIQAEEKAYEAAMAAKDDVQASMDVLEQLDNMD